MAFVPVSLTLLWSRLATVKELWRCPEVDTSLTGLDPASWQVKSLPSCHWAKLPYDELRPDDPSFLIMKGIPERKVLKHLPVVSLSPYPKGLILSDQIECFLSSKIGSHEDAFGFVSDPSCVSAPSWDGPVVVVDQMGEDLYPMIIGSDPSAIYLSALIGPKARPGIILEAKDRDSGEWLGVSLTTNNPELFIEDGIPLRAVKPEGWMGSQPLSVSFRLADQYRCIDFESNADKVALPQLAQGTQTMRTESGLCAQRGRRKAKYAPSPDGVFEAPMLRIDRFVIRDEKTRGVWAVMTPILPITVLSIGIVLTEIMVKFVKKTSHIKEE